MSTAAPGLSHDQRLLVASAGPFQVAAFFTPTTTGAGTDTDAAIGTGAGLFPAGAPRVGHVPDWVIALRPAWADYTVTAHADHLALTRPAPRGRSTARPMLTVARTALRRHAGTLDPATRAALAVWTTGDPTATAAAVAAALDLEPPDTEQTMLAIAIPVLTQQIPS